MDFKRVKHYYKKYRSSFFIGPLFKFLEAIFELFIPIVMASIIDVGIANKDKQYILLMGALMICLGLIGMGLALYCQYIASIASQGVGTTLRKEMLEKIGRIPITDIERLGTSSILNRITYDVNQIQVKVALIIRLSGRAPFILIGSTIMAFVINKDLARIFYIMTFLITIIIFVIMKKLIPYYKKVQLKLDELSIITRENFKGTRVVRAFNNEKKEEERFEKENDELAKASFKIGRISGMLNPLSSVVLNLAIVAILYFGAKSVEINTLTTGEVVALVNYMIQILAVLIVFGHLAIVFSKGNESAKRIEELLNIEETIKDGQVKKNVVNDDITNAEILNDDMTNDDITNGENLNDDITSDDLIYINEANNIEEVFSVKKIRNEIIRFENVSFTYDRSNEKIFDDISFAIKQGQKVGIIGKTGEGKTTLVNLLVRLIDPTKGTIYINGRDIKDYNLHELRKKIAIVHQKAQLFSGNVFDNLLVANFETTKKEAKEYLKVANALEFVEAMPEGIDSQINQGATNLSGGQKQRLSICRGLISKSEVLILDDSYSALDYKTADEIRKNIYKTLDKNQTLITISQRYRNLIDSDIIIVMDNGKIVGAGRHEDIIFTCEEYKEIIDSQSENEVLS